MTCIGEDVFYNCRGLTSITIPDSVTSIEKCAFHGCHNLTRVDITDLKAWCSIDFEGYEANPLSYAENLYLNGTLITNLTIPDSVTSIGDYAFYNCTGLTSVTFPNSVTSIGNSAFYNCTGLTSATIPDSVTSIGSRAFYGCKRWINITTGSSYFLGMLNFSDCPDLTTVVIENGITSIHDETFKNFSKLTSVTIPDSVTYIGNSAFEGCTELTSITIPDSVTFIGDYAFSSCKGLTGVNIPDSVTSIGEGAFDGCTGLTSVAIPDSITSIGNGVFYYCTGLTSITISDNVTSIGYMAFYGCTGLTDVYYNGTKTTWNKISISTYNAPLTNATKHYAATITLLDKNDNELSRKSQYTGQLIDWSAMFVSEGELFFLYSDKALTEPFEKNTPITEDMTLYVDFRKLNTLILAEHTEVYAGEPGITQKVIFVTDKTAKYLVCTVKYPSKLSLAEITESGFKIEQEAITEGDETFLSLTCVFQGDSMPINEKITPFELVFDVSKDAAVGDVLTVEILDDALLADTNGNSYEFVEIENSEIKIRHVFAGTITISGPDVIESPTTYTAVVSPAYTTNKAVNWSVSDETRATVSEDGTLTPVESGTVMLTATAEDGSGVSAQKTVTVKTLAMVTSISSNLGVWNAEYLPTQNNYTIYVPSATTSIRLTAKHNGTLESSDGKTFINNLAKSVPLTSGETNVTLNYAVDGYINNTYTITIVKFEGTKTTVSDDGKTFSVNPIGIENGKTVILVLYSGDRFVEIQSKPIESLDLTFTTTKEYTKAKVLVWNALESLAPVCKAEIIE